MTGPRTSMPYGPNTAVVRRFLQRLAGKPASDCIAAARSYLALQGTAELRTADRALGNALASSGRTDARDAIVGPLVQLMQGHSAKLDADITGELTVDDLSEAALAAALGLIVGDVIPGPLLEVLYRPFAEIIPLEEVEKGVV